MQSVETARALARPTQLSLYVIFGGRRRDKKDTQSSCDRIAWRHLIEGSVSFAADQSTLRGIATHVCTARTAFRRKKSTVGVTALNSMMGLVAHADVNGPV